MTTVVAVKTVKADADDSYFWALLSELKILAYLGTHENIASLVASSTSNIKNSEKIINSHVRHSNLLIV